MARWPRKEANAQSSFRVCRECAPAACRNADGPTRCEVRAFPGHLRVMLVGHDGEGFVAVCIRRLDGVSWGHVHLQAASEAHEHLRLINEIGLDFDSNYRATHARGESTIVGSACTASCTAYVSRGKSVMVDVAHRRTSANMALRPSIVGSKGVSCSWSRIRCRGCLSGSMVRGRSHSWSWAPSSITVLTHQCVLSATNPSRMRRHRLWSSNECCPCARLR